jgi:pilus assembly protein Flp/PilA
MKQTFASNSHQTGYLYARTIKRRSLLSEEAQMTTLRAFLSDTSGATSIEYAVMASGIALVLVAAISGLGDKVLAQYASVSTALN